jgi:hypothetical protein
MARRYIAVSSVLRVQPLCVAAVARKPHITGCVSAGICWSKVFLYQLAELPLFHLYEQYLYIDCGPAVPARAIQAIDVVKSAVH